MNTHISESLTKIVAHLDKMPDVFQFSSNPDQLKSDIARAKFELKVAQRTVGPIGDVAPTVYVSLNGAEVSGCYSNTRGQRVMVIQWEGMPSDAESDVKLGAYAQAGLDAIEWEDGSHLENLIDASLREGDVQDHNAAHEACVALVIAYRKGERNNGTMQWEDVDKAHAAAMAALGMGS